MSRSTITGWKDPPRTVRELLLRSHATWPTRKPRDREYSFPLSIPTEHSIGPCGFPRMRKSSCSSTAAPRKRSSTNLLEGWREGGGVAEILPPQQVTERLSYPSACLLEGIYMRQLARKSPSERSHWIYFACLALIYRHAMTRAAIAVSKQPQPSFPRRPSVHLTNTISLSRAR